MHFQVFLALAAILLASAAVVDVTEQVHLNYGSDPQREMWVTYSTRNRTVSACFLSLSSGGRPVLSFKGNSQFWGAPPQYIHTVKMTGLEPGRLYYFSLIDGNSVVGAFKTMSADPNHVTRLIIYGDFGLNNERSLPLLIKAAQAREVDAILHIGDIAYNLHDTYPSTAPAGSRGDAFMNSIQPVSANLPYHTCPGNHESDSDFAQYRARFSMPSSSANGNLFHTIKVPHATVILFSSEIYFYPVRHGMELLNEQFEYLKAALREANSERSVRPWVIMGCHRPMYCSPNDDSDDCHHWWSILRNGYPPLETFAVEPLLKEYGVDLFFGAHEHSYARSWPVYDSKVIASGDGAYVNPKGPIHILTGAAGCQEDQDGWKRGSQPFDAFHRNVYGFGTLEIFNGTHVRWSFVNDSSAEIIDSIDVVQSKHGPFDTLEYAGPFKGLHKFNPEAVRNL